MPVVIHIAIDKDYMQELDERLKKHGISHGQLAREAEISGTQLSRWFNTDIDPSLKNVVKIEAALHRLVRAQEREKRKAAKARGK